MRISLLCMWACLLSCAVFAQKAKKETLLIPYRIGNQWGYSDTQGKLKIPAKFEETDFFLQDLAKVRLNGLQGLIDKKGSFFLPCLYNIVYGAGSLTRIVVCKGGDKNGHTGKWGFVTRYFPEKTMISLDYDLLRECGGKGLLGVMQQGRWGAISGDGKLRIPIMYQVGSVKDHSFNPDSQLITSLPTDEIKDSPYLKLRFEDGLARVSKDKKWGFLNEAGNPVIPIEYAFVGEFSEDLVAVVRETPEGLRLGFVNSFNEMIIPLQYEVRETAYQTTKFANNLALVCQAGKFGYINPKNETVIPFKYAQAHLFSEDRAWVSYDYHSLQPAWEMLDKEGNTLYKLPTDYQLLDYTFQQGFVRVRQAGKENFINRKGNLLLKDWANHLEPFYDNIAFIVTQIGEKAQAGYVNSKGDWAIEPLYDYKPNNTHTQRTSDFIKLSQAGKVGIINTKGKIILPFIYDDIILPYYLPDGKLYGNDSYLPACYEGKWGYLNAQQVWAVMPKYEQARSFSAGYAKVKYEGKWGYIDTKGKEFWQF